MFFRSDEFDPDKDPCVRNCCLDQEDVCLGCFRHVDEICGWYQMSKRQKVKVLKRCQQRREAKSQS